MKKTYNINIAGRPFVIDEDAYEMLENYLDAIRKAFGNRDYGTELLEDIESRIAEILAENLELHGTLIVTADDIRSIITRIGTPEDMVSADDVDISATESVAPDSERIEKVYVEEGSTPPPFTTPGEQPKIKKRLFRNPDDHMLGGVCSGVAAYFDIDPTWVRLGVVLLCFASFSSVLLVYFILWLVLPEANTPLEKLQMHGEAPTVDNIGQAVANGYSHAYSRAAETVNSNGFKSFLDTMLKICAVAAKVLMIFLGIVAVPIVISILIGLVGCFIGLFVTLLGYTPDFMCSILGLPSLIDIPVSTVVGALLTAIAALCVVGIPAVAFLVLGLNLLRHKSWHVNTQWVVTLCIVWFITLCATAIGTTAISHRYGGGRLEGMLKNVEMAAERLDELSDHLSEMDTVIDENMSATDGNMPTLNDSILQNDPVFREYRDSISR